MQTGKGAKVKSLKCSPELRISNKEEGSQPIGVVHSMQLAHHILRRIGKLVMFYPAVASTFKGGREASPSFVTSGREESET